MSIKLGIILGSGIEIESGRVKDINLLEEDNSGIHKKIRYRCRFEGHSMLVLQGRVHFYEGYGYKKLIDDINFIEQNEVENLIITNAAGGVNDNFYISDLMLIRSHINLNNQLVYKQKAFTYDLKLSELFKSSCMEAGVRLHEGVYGYYQGPTYETKSEIRFQKKFHIDAAGMSTVPESSAAALSGIKVIGLSVITNILKENNTEPASHESVIVNAKVASVNLNKALSVFIPQLN